MDPGRWEQIQATFDALVQLDPSARAVRLQTLGTTDPELRAAVESLLGVDAEVDRHLAALESAFLPPGAPTPDLLSLSGRTVSHFRILQPLGAGGMGVVYRAEDSRLGRPVALKFLLPHFGFDDSAKTRFLREARSAAALDHPNLCTIYEVGETEDGRLFLAMALYAGETLKARLDREGQLSVPDTLEIARQIAQGLASAHAVGVVHRDLKPGNVMLLPDGTVKILDFGLARARGDSQAGFSAGSGTAAYMAPEQVRGEAVDARTDLWALGVVLYEMVTGRRPFGREYDVAIAHAILEEEPAPPSKLRADVPPQLEYVILTLLEKKRLGRLWDATGVVDALTSRSAVRRLPAHRRDRRFWFGGLAAVAVLGLLIGIVRMRSGAGTWLDPNLVAIAPFDILDPRLELWHEGLVDVLSRNLDGSGPLRTVSPTVVVRRWRGRGDPVSAMELGRQTGAGLVAFGQLLPARGDSVRVMATLYDVTRRSPVRDIEVRDLEANMDRVADSLTIGLLRELRRTRVIGAIRLGSLGSTSLPAVKAFLRGEQFLRHATYDSARAYALDAVAIDSNFVLALKLVTSTFLGIYDPARLSYQLREGALNHGLAPRESLSVEVDSLWGALFSSFGGIQRPLLLRRLYTTLEIGVQRYPDDPELWVWRGELGYHQANAHLVPLTMGQTFESFQRAIQLDSAFIPAYDHVIELALRLRGPQLARRYVLVSLAGEPSSFQITGRRLVSALLEPRAANSSEVYRMIDTVSDSAFFASWYIVKTWADSAETAVRLARQLGPPRHGYQAQDSGLFNWILPLTLAYRGHLREANSELSTRVGWIGWSSGLFAESALLGAVPHDSAAAVFGGWLRSNKRWMGDAAAWWAANGDTASLEDLRRRADSLARFATWPNEGPYRQFDRAYWQYQVAALRAYRALARHDTTGAITALKVLPDSLCPYCFLEAFTLGGLLTARGQDSEAAALLERELFPPRKLESPTLGIWVLERGRVNERLGNKEKALAAYRFVADLWIHADPELQRYVAEAREGLRRLGAKSES